MRCGCVIVAAGRGVRLGFESPKAFVPLGSKPLFRHSLDVFLSHPFVREVILVVPGEKLDALLEIPCRIVAGGDSRQESVSNGLSALSPNCSWVMVHDAARPFVTMAVIERLLEQMRQSKNSIAAWPVSDTVKMTEGHFIVKTIDRQNLFWAQTPQLFSVDLLKRALLQAEADGFTGTDEASLVERLGVPVEAVPGDPLNIKITTKEDLVLAEAILRRELCE